MNRITLAVLASVSLAAAAHAQAKASVTVENSLNIVRHDETVAVPWAEVQAKLAGVTATTVRVLDAEGREIPSQVVDNDGNGTLDELIFQGDFERKERRHFTVEAAAPSMKYEPKVSVRHDDPRDDMAWESDPHWRFAARTVKDWKKTSSAMSRRRSRRVEQDDARADRGEVVHQGARLLPR